MPSRPLRGALLLIALGAVVTAAPSMAVAAPAGCYDEKRTQAGAVDPTGLCVSYGYGVRPAGQTGSATRNVVAYAEGKVAMPFDYYARSDVAAEIATGKARPRATYLLLFGGAFVCGSRSQLSAQARELAARGYLVVAPEYPLAGALSSYGYFKPNPTYSQDQITKNGANSCNDFGAVTGSSGWTQNYLPKLKARGLESDLQQSQWVLQQLIRTLKTNRSYGVDPKRIFAVGSSAGGSVAIRLALGGNADKLPSGNDPGDSTIAGAVSVSGPSCFPGSKLVTTPMLFGQIKPSEVPACRLDVDASDPPVVMIQEPRGGVDDAVVPSTLMLAGCNAINAAGAGRKCIYEDRAPAAGGYIADGAHATIGWSNWVRLFDVLAAQTVGQP